MTDEELTKATEQYLKENPRSNQEAEVTTSSKRKSEDDELKEQGAKDLNN